MPQQPNSPSQRRGLWLIALGAAIISAAPVLVTQLARAGVGPTAAAAGRTLLGSAVLFGLAAAAARGSRWRALWPGRRTVGFALAAGAAFAADLSVWHRSILIVGAGLATILANTQVFWTATFGRVFHAEPLSRRFATAAGAAFVGVALLVGLGSELPERTDYVLGVALGLATGVCYATYLLTLRQANTLRPTAAFTTAATSEASTGRSAVRAATHPRAPTGLSRTVAPLAWATLSAGVLLTLGTAATSERLLPSNAAAWVWLCSLAIGPQVAGWLLIASGLPHVPASRGALVLLLQPVLATAWGVLFFGEQLTTLQALGAVITLAGIYVGSRR